MTEPLPTLHHGQLSPEQVGELFNQLARFATIDGVCVKGGPQAYTTGEGPDLATAAQLVQTRSVRGVQIRYRYAGEAWFDTLMILPEGVRLVRIAAPS